MEERDCVHHVYPSSVCVCVVCMCTGLRGRCGTVRGHTRAHIAAMGAESTLYVRLAGVGALLLAVALLAITSHTTPRNDHGMSPYSLTTTPRVQHQGSSESTETLEDWRIQKYTLNLHSGTGTRVQKLASEALCSPKVSLRAPTCARVCVDNTHCCVFASVCMCGARVCVCVFWGVHVWVLLCTIAVHGR